MKSTQITAEQAAEMNKTKNIGNMRGAEILDHGKAVYSAEFVMPAAIWLDYKNGQGSRVGLDHELELVEW